jgi:hypothetical protein
MARHTAALLVQYGTLRTLVVTSVVAVAPRRAADAAAARVSQPLCAAAHRRVGARDCARAALLDALIEVRESVKGLIASVLRGQALSLGVAQLRADFCLTGALERRHSAARRCARLSRTTCRTGCSALRRRWRSTRLPRRASAATPRAVPRSEFFRTRGRAIDELGVTRPSCSQLVRVAAQLRELSATQTHNA